MLHSTNRVLLIILVIVQLGFATEKQKVPRVYETGKITDVQRKTSTKVLYYVVNTPITKDEPYFEISVQIKDQVILGRYTPRHADEEIPEDWNPGSPIQARVDAHHLYLKRPSGQEMDLIVVKRTPAKELDNSPSTPAKN